jgi:UDP-3-O-[3-hydroxymyristoyl] glucosamine N-acyltransferase
MPTRLAELRDLVQGRLRNDGEVAIHGAAALANVRAGEITLIDQAKKADQLARSAAAAAVVPPGTEVGALPAIEVEDVHAAFERIVVHFRPPRGVRRIGVSNHALVSQSARLGSDVDVHPWATIDDDVEIGRGVTIHAGVHVMAGCRIGEQVTIFSNAVLYEETRVGARCIIHAGAVIGAYGFGYKVVEGRHHLSAQLGWVELGDDVEVGAGATIDRGSYGPTIVGEGTKIDNLVQIAHNCRIGRHNLICAQVGIAGSTTTGDYVVMAGQVGVKDHVHVGDRAVLGAMAGVMADVPAGETWAGIPAANFQEIRHRYVAFGRLPEMRHDLRNLERAVEELKRRNGGGGHAAA